MSILIAYYSRAGENYASGGITNLAVGNTEVVAKKIAALTGAEQFKIDTVKEYPYDYTETTEVAKFELRQNARPVLSQHLSNMKEYDTLFLGYPNWWGTMPMAVFTFLEEYDMDGKTIIPFCTHEGSGIGGVSDIKMLCQSAKIEKGLALIGSTVEHADKEIEAWLKEVL